MRVTVASAVLFALVGMTTAWAEPSAEDVLKVCGIDGGLVVQLGCGDGSMTAALGGEDSLLVQGLDTDPENVEKARAHFQSLRVGGRVSADWFDGRQLPYADNLVNLLVAEDLGEVAMPEVMRVLCPGGVAYVKQNGTWRKTIKPRPDETDEWTHFLHGPDNNAVSRDSVVGPPRCLQWVSNPIYGRDHSRLASVSAMVSAEGRLFTIEDRGPALSIELPAVWRLIARDAFNGVTLWERPIRAWEPTTTKFRSGPVQLPRRLVAIGDQVYVALHYGGPLLCLDAATGATLKTYDGTAGADEILYLDGALYLAASESGVQPKRRILAVAAGSGEIRWENDRGPAAEVLPGTLAAGPKRLYFHDSGAVVALDRATGRVLWRTPLPAVSQRPSWLAPTVVYHDGVVLCGDRAVDYDEKWKQNEKLAAFMLAHGCFGQVTALAADDGAVLWKNEASECFHNAVNVFVIGGLVWTSQGPGMFYCGDDKLSDFEDQFKKEFGERFYVGKITGRDPQSGQVKKTIDATEAFTWIHHHRCYRDKATERYIILGRTGVEFIDLAGGPCLRNNWTRGMCQYGVMPANGLLYVPPHPCQCWASAKVSGFFAYSSRKEPGGMDPSIPRLRKGPAYGVEGAGKREQGKGLASLTSRASPLTSASDWPTYRHDTARSGCGKTQVADRLAVAWRCDLSGKLSAPTSADGKVFVSAVDRHTVYALRLDDGERLWSYVAGGRVDSPPTYWQGRVYFGSADGHIQCLDAADGSLVWQFFAAPVRESIVAWNQLESPWPVAGSVLVRDGSVYALAGRSSHLDGGMYFVKLEALTGRPQRTNRIYLRDPDFGPQGETHVVDGGGPGMMDMAGLQYDIPSSTGSSIFVRGTRLSLDGTMMSDQPQPHLFNPGGFLDGTWWHRYYIVYGARFTRDAISGGLLVHDGKHVYGYGHAGSNNRRLFCAETGAVEPTPPGSTSQSKQVRRGRGDSSGTTWSSAGFPIMVRAMALACASGVNDKTAGRLVVGGPSAAGFRDIAILRGEQGGLLGVIDAATGRSVSQIAIEAPPVFDGLCAVRGRVVVSLTSGAVVSFK